MRVTTVPDTSVALGVRLAHEQMLRRRREAKVRLSRERIKNLIRALVCGGIVAALLALGIFTGWVPLLGSSAVASRELSADRSAEMRTGQMLVPTFDGVFCRQVLFNNETGLLSDEKTVRCEEAMSANSKSRMSRDLSDGLRGGFKKK